ncbi:uncharacterized protein LOC107790474 [Nicotiana tabacum]|uniref:UPF0587 protein CG4646-like n=2 Tax=Nicotiana TaxID=4085 RepID=A0A1S3ZTZ7_TOBAC|nr:PREDICTED: UPF0587 protein CG4646-like [Nicotiana sylvestris]XP_016467885.1 PREDICTED: UPF0587 protein CG4646-like [Nicotiana tabacum]
MKYLLEITANLTHIVEMTPEDGVDDPNMPYFFRLKCENCDIVSKEQCVYPSEVVYHKRKRVNHVIKCKGCKRVGTVKLVPGSESVFTAAAAAGGIYMPLMMFECEGLVPQQYAFNGGWKLTTDTGEDIMVNLVNGYFAGSEDEYGDNQPVVANVRGRFTPQ